MEHQTDLLNEFSGSSMEYATTGQRFANYLVDVIMFYIALFILGLLLAASGLYRSMGMIYLMTFVIFLGYYTLMEGSGGRTIGKLVTKTRAVTLDGQPITFKDAFLRSLCRLIPFEFISAFTGSQMWHDKWTNTMVVKN